MAAAPNHANIPDNMHTTSAGCSAENQQRVNAYLRRKRKKKNGRGGGNSNKGQHSQQRIKRKDRNFGTNNDLSPKQEKKLFNSLCTAVGNHRKLTNNELTSVFQQAISNLNAAWFRDNLAAFFEPNQATMDDNDIILLILRLFILPFDLQNTRHKVPFRYLLLDLVIPAMHTRYKRGNTVFAGLLKPTPTVTDFHKLHALHIFNAWVLQITQNIDDTQWPLCTTSTNSTAYLPTEQKQQTQQTQANNTYNHPQTTHQHVSELGSNPYLQSFDLSALRGKEMESLFYSFELDARLTPDIRHKLCSKVYHLLYHDRWPACAVNWTNYFHLNIPHEVLLTPLLQDQGLLHHAVNYVDCLSSRKPLNHPVHIQHAQAAKDFIVLTIARLIDERKTSVTSSRAVKLLHSWKYAPDRKEFEPLLVSQIESFLRWTIHKGHVDDYALLLCSHSKRLQRFLVTQCRKHPTTFASCVKWAKHFGLENDPQCRGCVKHCAQWLATNKGNVKSKAQTFIDGFDDLPYCDVDLKHVLFVCDTDSLKQARAILLDKTVECLGLDLELLAAELPLPNMPDACQILQIGTRERACVFDLPSMAVDDTLFEAFDDLLTDVFESEAVKIGIGWDGDLRNLRKQFPDALAFKSACSPYLDLSLVQRFMKNDAEFLEKTAEWKLLDDAKESLIKLRFKKNKGKEGGLAKIVRFVLGLKLNKFEQLSNWCNRPLRTGQLKYAALDAMVECWIYKKFQEWEKDHIMPSLKGFCDDLYGQAI